MGHEADCGRGCRPPSMLALTPSVPLHLCCAVLLAAAAASLRPLLFPGRSLQGSDGAAIWKEVKNLESFVQGNKL